MVMIIGLQNANRDTIVDSYGGHYSTQTRFTEIHVKKGIQNRRKDDPLDKFPMLRSVVSPVH